MKIQSASMLFVVLATWALSACAPNAAWRKLGEQDGDCRADSRTCQTNATTEIHPGFKLSFAEFSERGNLFDQAARNRVLAQLRDEGKRGVVVVVFVHGWQHNADPTDDNVRSFRKALAAMKRSGVAGDRPIHGVYIGWRGLGLDIPGLKYLTYWDRKTIAAEVGRGGLTDFLVELETVTHGAGGPAQGMLLVVAHSFGGAVVLSALDSVFLERLTADAAKPSATGSHAVFGDGVVLLNPAIEANQAFPLKELSQRIGAKGGVAARSLHVISSEGDFATHWAFPISQHLGTGITWQHATITREYAGKEFRFSELALDTATIGNFERFRTHRINAPGTERDQDGADSEVWTVESLCEPLGQKPHDPKHSPIPCTTRDPVSVVYTSPRFIKDHSDVFNARVLAYVSAVVSESLVARQADTFPACEPGLAGNAFNACFKEHRRLFANDRQLAVESAAQTGQNVADPPAVPPATKP